MGGLFSIAATAASDEGIEVGDINNDAEAVFDALDMVQSGLRSVAADFIMKNAGYNLVADKRAESSEDCGYAVRRQWMTFKDDEEYCFYLEKKAKYSDWEEPSEDVYNSLAEYGLGERYYYYRAILDCALSDKEEKKPSLTDLTDLTIGGVPEFLFSMRAAFIEELPDGQCHPPATTCIN